MTKVLCVGLGNEFRGDDGIGFVLLHHMRTEHPEAFDYLHHNGEPTDLMERWHNRHLVLVDAIAPGDNLKPGNIIELHPLQGDRLALSSSPSSHGASLAEALSWGYSLGKLPYSLTVYGVVGASFNPGNTLTPAVAQTIPILTEKLLSYDKETATNA